jgi:hypothetical protein
MGKRGTHIGFWWESHEKKTTRKRRIISKWIQEK